MSRGRHRDAARLVYVRSFADTNIWRVETESPGAPATSPPVVAIASTRRDAIAGISLPTGAGWRSRPIDPVRLEIWVADADRRQPIQLTSMGVNPGFPRWSPDGEGIAFHSNPDGQGDIIVVPAEGGKPRNLTSHPATDTFPSFSRDGRWIYFSSTERGSR